MTKAPNIFSDRELVQRSLWLVRMRWWALAGIAAVIVFVLNFTAIHLTHGPLFLGLVIITGYNIYFLLYYRRYNGPGDSHPAAGRRTANLQIAADLFMLSWFIHYSGGIENPFNFYFIFHMIIGSMLLSNRAAYLQATLAIILWGGVIIGENTGLLRHYHLNTFTEIQCRCLLSPWYYLTGTFVAFASSLYIAVYFSTTLVNRMRRKDQELARANKLLSEQDKLRSQYIHTVSHDLRSSLSTIQSCLQVVLNDLTGAIPEKAREMVTRAEQRSKMLLRFVSDLLHLSRIRAEDDLEMADISLGNIVEKLVEQWQIKAQAKKISLSLNLPSDPMVVHANQPTIEQVFINLIENALRYTPWGGGISVDCRVLDREDAVRIAVKDSGIGISEEDVKLIFKDFYRAKNAEQMEKEGTGFGLSIVKQIIKIHRGKIWVESELGKGSTFIVTLPRGRSTNRSGTETA